MQKKERRFNLFLPAVAGLVVVLLVVLISCHKSAVTPEPEAVNRTLAQPFTATAALHLDGMEATADIGKTANGQFTFMVTEPESLKGLCFTYNGEQVGVDYRGLNFQVNDDSLLAKGAATVLLNAVNAAAADSGVKVNMDGDTIKVKGDTDDGKFAIALSKQTGALLSLNVPSVDLDCTFSDFAFGATTAVESQTPDAETESNTPTEKELQAATGAEPAGMTSDENNVE